MKIHESTKYDKNYQRFQCLTYLLLIPFWRLKAINFVCCEVQVINNVEVIHLSHLK